MCATPSNTYARPAIGLGVISNFDRRLRTVLADLKLAPFFEHVVISSEVGRTSLTRVFSSGRSLLFGVAADSALHVGDDPHKDWGAEALGLAVFRLERPCRTRCATSCLPNISRRVPVKTETCAAIGFRK